MAVCQQYIHNPNATGSLQSPNYPNNDPANLSCTYHFEMRESGYSMVIDFTHFQLEGAATNSSCSSDYLQVPFISCRG